MMQKMEPLSPEKRHRVEGQILEGLIRSFIQTPFNSGLRQYDNIDEARLRYLADIVEPIIKFSVCEH